MSTFSKMNEMSKQTNNRRLANSRKKHGFKSQSFPLANTRRHDNREGKRILRQIYLEAFQQDLSNNWQLKKPRGGKLEPELVSGTSIDVYYGKNVDIQPSLISHEHVCRYAYATGTGIGSIGQDPTTKEVKPWKPVFGQLLEIVKQSVMERSTYNAAEKAEIVSKLDNCNAVSMKWYYTVPGVGTEKTTNWHTDMSLRSDNNQPITGSNSQVPDTPVAILTYGGKKRIYFGYGKDKRTIQGNSTFFFEQCDSKIFLLHWEDEKYHHEDGSLPYKRFLHCSGVHPDNKDGVVMTLLFRHVSTSVLVNRNTNKFVDPQPREDQLEFDQMRDNWMEDDEVVAKQVELAGKVQTYYNKTNW